MPVKLGRGGAEQVVEYDLTAEERAALATSANAVRELCAAVDRLMVENRQAVYVNRSDCNASVDNAYDERWTSVA